MIRQASRETMMNKGMKWKKKRRYKGPLSERAVLRVEFVMFMLFVLVES